MSSWFHSDDLKQQGAQEQAAQVQLSLRNCFSAGSVKNRSEAHSIGKSFIKLSLLSSRVVRDLDSPRENHNNLYK